ncbi:MAG: hypothetical protein HQL63_02970 [Magnetococcales bacterium]|nr:hypothetical protein [Magnetococcales bacterium]
MRKRSIIMSLLLAAVFFTPDAIPQVGMGFGLGSGLAAGMADQEPCRFLNDGGKRAPVGAVVALLLLAGLAFLLYRWGVTPGFAAGLKWMTGLFLLAFLLTASWTWRSWQDWRKFGEVILSVTPCPPRLGMPMRAEVILAGEPGPGALPPGEETLHLTLVCEKSTWIPGSDVGEVKGWQEQIETLWQKVQQAGRIPTASHPTYVATFDLPQGHPASAPPASKPLHAPAQPQPGIRWIVHLRGDGGLAYLDRRFEVPIY